MPFKSTAQQRFMYARHPEIAQRWSSEMKRSKRKGAKEHPIKAAHLPGHVHKSQGTATVGKRMTSGSFQRGGSTIVAHGNLGPRDRRGTKLQRYGGGGVRRGTRKPLEEYSKGLTGVLEDAKLGMSMGRDLRPGMLAPGGGAKLTPGARAGKLLGASTATAGRTAATVGGAAAAGGGLVGLRNNQNNQNVNKGPVWTPTSVAMNSQPIGPAAPLSTTAPVSTAAGGQVRQGALIPTSKPVQANVAGRAAGGQKSGSIRANGTMGAAATTGSVGATAAAQPTSKMPVTKADGTLTIRSHGPNRRYYDPESRRQRRMGQAQGALTVGGAASLGAGAHELHRVNRRTAAVNGADLKSTAEGKVINNLTTEPHAIVGNRRSAALIGAGALGLASANRIRRHANNPHNREWS